MSGPGVFARFLASEQAGGVALLLATLLALGVANSPCADAYAALWATPLGGLTVLHWVNDGLMAVFFLHVGLELERELYVGELADRRNATLALLAALGGMAVPALLHFALNAGTDAQRGAGIPMATDIAFALGILALLGRRVPITLKVFLTAVAVADDLGAVLVIALVYSGTLSTAPLVGALAVFLALVAVNRWGVRRLWPYLLGGVVLWALTLRSGIHPTVAGVALAFAIPFRADAPGTPSPSERLEDALHLPVAVGILPLFALANTALRIDAGAVGSLVDANSLGIMLGLVLGKPVGILLGARAGVALGCALPAGLGWRHLAGAGLLGGIGFTMSIFIATLAFPASASQVEASKLAILAGSAVAGGAGIGWLWWVTRAEAGTAGGPATPGGPI